MNYAKKIFAYVKKKYGIEPDYPLPTAPGFPVLRHPDNRKWFAIMMDVPREKLGLSGEGRADVINVKLGDPFYAENLIHKEGYFKGYHLNKGNWITVMIDGTVPLKEICRLIDESYLVTASEHTKKAFRKPKEWVVPANPKYYDIEHAFDSEDEIDWKQGRGIQTGDTVYLYVAAPVSAILFRCLVTETDIPYRYVDHALTITALMKLKLTKRYAPDRFTFEKLKTKYDIMAVRGPCSVPSRLSKALKREEKKPNNK